MSNYIVISDDDYFDLEIIKNFQKLNLNNNIRCFIASTPNLSKIQRELKCDIFFWKDLNFKYKDKLSKIVHLDEIIYKKYYECEQIHNQMLDFINPDGNNFSNLEIRRNYRQTLEFCLSIIETYRPDYLIFTNIPHSYYTAVLYQICKIKKIPTIIIRETLPKIYIFEKVDHEINRSFFGSINNKKITIGERKKNIEDFENQNLKNMFSSYRNHKLINSKVYNLKPFIFIYTLFYFERLFFLFFSIFKNIIKTFIYFMKKKFKTNFKINFQNPLSLADSLKISGKSLEKSNNTEFFIALKLFKQDIKKICYYHKYKNLCKQIISNEKYIYFPLHFQPEATTYPYGNFYVDQINAIKLLSECSDDDTFIYVKEHPDTFNLSRFAWYRGMFSRDIQFYEEISKINKVKFIDLKYDSTNLIKKSILTSSITGTSALQAVLEGKHAIVFGDCWYKFCEGVYNVASKDDLRSYFENKKFSKNIDKNKVSFFFQYLNHYSFEGSKSGITNNDNFIDIAKKLNENVNEILSLK